VFAFDPSLGLQLETAAINEVTLRVPWEAPVEGSEGLRPGPVGEYLEVIDVDPPSRCSYWPVHLNDPHVVAQDGLAPSESSPQFHQQMAYAVAMRIISDFERALGRVVIWAPRPYEPATATEPEREEQFVRRLRIHPHALREPNAYYSPDRVAVLFGYFAAPNATDDSPLTVFTCLSHDIIAHELTHALLDGIHRRFTEDTNPDVAAFHEAFADIVALFSHFSLPEVLRHQIAMTRGDLASQNRLGELAQEFGEAIGTRGALRSAIGQTDPETGEWTPIKPDPTALQRVIEPHDRGAILVAAVFGAFLTIYRSRIADLLRIASEGTGVLREGQLHPDLVNRLAGEAARSARHVLDVCIRALDYCPPVDITFGDYLRALVTADYEYDPVDDAHRRVAFVEAFRRWGIVPEGIRAFSVGGLLWRPASGPAGYEEEDAVIELVKEWGPFVGVWRLPHRRERAFELARQLARELHSHLKPMLETGPGLAGIDPKRAFEVHSIRPSMRTGANRETRYQWVIELTQRLEDEGFPFRGGCTLLVDAETGNIRYSITKTLNDARRLRQQEFLARREEAGLAAIYFRDVLAEAEPFAMLHRRS
jgi:hypothetical protein